MQNKIIFKFRPAHFLALSLTAQITEDGYQFELAQKFHATVVACITICDGFTLNSNQFY